MRNVFYAVVFVLFCFLLTREARASDKRIGQIVAPSASRNNQTTAAPFKTSTGLPKHIAIQCDQDVYVAGGTGSSTAAASTDVKVTSGKFWEVKLTRDEDTLAVNPTSAVTATCQVFEVLF